MLIVLSQHRKPTGVPGQAAVQLAVPHASEAKFVTWFCAYKGVTRLRKLNSSPQWASRNVFSVRTGPWKGSFSKCSERKKTLKIEMGTNNI